MSDPTWRLVAYGVTATIPVALGMPALQGFGDKAFLVVAVGIGVVAAQAAIRVLGQFSQRLLAPQGR